MASYIPVLHSVSYAGAWPGHSRLDVDAFLLKAVELGYQQVALVAKQPHVSPLDYDQAARTALKTRLRELGLTLAALMGYTDFTAGMDRPGLPSAEMNAAYVGSLARLARDLDTPRLRIFTGYQRPGVGYDLQYGELVRGLRMAARASAPHGVTLLLQNHHDLACHHDQLVWLLEEVNEPNLRLAFDAWAPHLQGITGDELAAAVKKAGPWLEFTTVADYEVQRRFRYDPERVNYVPESPALVRAVAPGTGEVDYASFFRGLAAINYRGPVAYEMCAVLRKGGGVENLDSTARAFLQFLSGKE
ncbi:MAG TPA: sugar phosphate isomerase/epimerase family protein [Bryobacteraceae bacterium]|nr:sugar phosphate isomerase/epimerase family protein [Bryobacteraceae bacterium]